MLDKTFYAALRGHPVPLPEAAIRQPRDRSMSFDIYPQARMDLGDKAITLHPAPGRRSLGWHRWGVT